MAERPWWGEFLCAGTSAVLAICCTNPVDVVKTRMVLQGRSAGKSAYTGVVPSLLHIGRTEGVRGLQRGLWPACFWQFSNVSCRFGFYAVAKDYTGVGNTEKTTSPFAQWIKSLGLAAGSGALGSLVSNPFFIVKTRHQAAGDAALSQVQMHGVWRSLAEMYNSDGPRGWMRGISAFMPRVIVASSVQLSTYDLVKGQFVQKIGLNPAATSTHIAASMVTGLAVVVAMQPWDFACTRLVNTPTSFEKSFSSSGPSKTPVYTGPMDVIRKTIASEGILGIYSGVSANYWRFGPYCVLTFVFVERLRELERIFLRR